MDQMNDTNKLYYQSLRGGKTVSFHGQNTAAKYSKMTDIPTSAVKCRLKS